MNVILSNKLPQLVTVSVKDEAGNLVEMRLGPHENSAPFPDDRLTDHARLLVSKGHLRLRPAAG